MTMSLIKSDADEFKKQFIDYMKRYKDYYLVVAWEGQEFDVSEKLQKYQKKIIRVVVGLYFCQTMVAKKLHYKDFK